MYPSILQTSYEILSPLKCVKVGGIFSISMCTGLNSFPLQLLKFFYVELTPGLYGNTAQLELLTKDCYKVQQNYSLPMVMFESFTPTKIYLNHSSDWFTTVEPEVHARKSLLIYFLAKSTIWQNPCANKSIEINGVLAEPKFNKEYLGFTVYIEDIQTNPGIMQELVLRSPKLIIENRSIYGNQTEGKSQFDFFQILSKLLTDVSGIQDDAKISLVIKLNIDSCFELHLELCKFITKQAVNAAIYANNIKHGFVSAILLTFEENIWGEPKILPFDDIFHSVKGKLSGALVPKLGVVGRVSIKFFESLIIPKTVEIFVFEVYHNFDGRRPVCLNERYLNKAVFNDYQIVEQKFNLSFSNQIEFWRYLKIKCNIPMSSSTHLDYHTDLLSFLSEEAQWRRTKIFVNNAFRANSGQAMRECGWYAVHKDNSTGKYRIRSRIEVFNNIYNNHTKNITNGTVEIQSPNLIYRNNQQSLTSEFSVAHYLWWILLSVMIVLIVLGVTCFFMLRYRSMYRLRTKEITSFFNGESRSVNRNEDVQGGSNRALSVKYNRDKYEIPSSRYSIDKTQCLGSGVFGIVYRASLQTCEGETRTAAVKTTKSKDILQRSNVGFTHSLRGLMSEIKILSYIGEHQHIIGLLGANTSKLQSGQILVFLEFCENGSLFNYLRSIGPEEDLSLEPQETEVDSRYENLELASRLDAELSIQFLKFAKEIADGMEYLAAKMIVHADLATRNVLLDSNNVAKISDFGLSRRLYEYSHYVKRNQEPLPWRWMAPEALRKN